MRGRKKYFGTTKKNIQEMDMENTHFKFGG